MFELAVLSAVAFAAGILNSIAGGGTFLTFPALVWAGVPPVAANATSAVAVFPGYLGGAAGFRRELSQLNPSGLRRVNLHSLVCGVIGALLLLITPNELFTTMVPFLLVAATATFAFQAPLQRLRTAGRFAVQPFRAPGLLLVSVCGGYFNGGLGIVLLALYSLWGLADLNAMNGLKNAASFVISAVSVTTFAGASVAHWPEALLMILAAAGGYAGARLARRRTSPVVRALVIAIGVSMSAAFFARPFELTRRGDHSVPVVPTEATVPAIPNRPCAP